MRPDRQGTVTLARMVRMMERGFSKLTPLQRTAVILLLAVCIGLSLYTTGCTPTPNGIAPPAAGADGYLFCFWNVENLFDDQFDRRTGPGDRDYDPWLSQNADIRREKLGKLTEAILKLNGGRGPDILALVEVESVRAAELLQQALNAKLTDPALHYHPPLMKEVRAGRHIAPAILTRLPAVHGKTRRPDSRRRILETHLVVDGQELVVVASHWTSRLDGGSDGRAKYADKIYGAFHAMHRSNPAVDFLVCGDFNDAPEDVSVTKHLRATGDRAAVLNSRGAPQLFNLFAGKDPAKSGTLYHSGWFIFDQIAVSPGLLDSRGWSCDPESVQTVKTTARPGDRLGRPWRFGSASHKGPRGYSDHFPVTVRLKVNR